MRTVLVGVDPARSRNMAAIQAKHTAPELAVRKALFSRGFRYRLHARGLPGRPDIVLRRYCAVVLVHGCFWHAHEGCPYFQLPRTRPEFWKQKLEANVQRDRRDMERLMEIGWRIAVVWECAIRNSTDKVAEELEQFLRGKSQLLVITP